MYATLDHLKTLCGDEELIQLTDRADPPSGQIDVVVVTAALGAATNEIDGYVAAQYALPLASTPPLLQTLACDIARYRLYTTAATDQVRQRYEDAVKALTNISKGVIKLPVISAPGGPAEPEGRDDVMVIQSEDRIFSRSSMKGW
ncbi:gp436 family protein [Brevundimonas sp.]|uniref:gp436 family protein n=1 Tax=Brevundimonas sp. TaxID=1871086 RepID=UPI003F6F4E2A